MAKPLRELMPTTTAFIDECREAFGVDMVNQQIKLGMRGAQSFYASENGQEVGTKIAEGHGMTLDQMVIKPHPAKTADKWSKK